MPARPQDDIPSVLMNIYKELYRRYGPQHWWPARTPFEVCVGAILVQNTAWANVERAISQLDKAGVLAFKPLAALPENQLKELIRPAGFFNVKAKRLRAFLDFLGQHYDGDIESLAYKPWPVARMELLAVHGIGHETADSILLYALQKPVFVIDAYTRRLLQAQGFVAWTENYHAMQALFMDNLPSDVVLYNEYHALIVALGKERSFSLGHKPGLFYNKNHE